ncbi:MAG: hypothetical protein ABJA11_04750 [Pseudolysinimonas sp.]
MIWVIGKRADSEVYELTVSRLKTHPNLKFAAELRGLIEVIFTE